MKAWDTVFRRFVAAKILPAGLSCPGSGAPLFAAWERWHEAPHPALLKPIALNFQQRQLVREWATGFTLVDLLRKRQRLKAEEAVALLTLAAPAMDHAAGHGLLTDTLLDKWFVVFADEDVARAVQPLAAWPAWSVRLDPLRMANLVLLNDGRTRQMPAYSNGHEAGIAPAVKAARSFVRELLGDSDPQRATPLAALDDEGNRVLAAAASRDGFSSAQDFAATLAASLPQALPSPPEPDRAARRFEIAVDSQPDRGGCLILEPEGSDTRPLRLVRGEEFRIGRSATQAHIALRFAEPAEGGDALAANISRVHARLRRNGAELRLLDGTEAGPSSNGTFTHDGPLTDPGGIPVTRQTVFQAGAHWRGTIAPVPAPGEAAVLPGCDAENPASGPRWGAVFILPWKNCTVVADTVWLIEEAGFGLSADGQLAWDWEGIGTPPASFRMAAEGGFYLLNRRLGEAELSIDSRPLKPGEACALREGMLFAAGRERWRFHID